MSGQIEGKLSGLFARLLDDRSGATAIEYALIAGGASIVIVGAVQGVGSKLVAIFTSVQSAFN